MEEVQAVNQSSAPRIFDPQAADLQGYWLILVNGEGFFLVPSKRGGWTQRIPYTPRVLLKELPPMRAAEWWGMLTGSAAARPLVFDF